MSFAPGLTLARVIRIVAGIVAAVILLAILLIVLDANPANTIVSHIRDWGGTLSEPFHGIFKLSSHKGTIALSYGLAIIVYLVVAGICARLLAATTFAGGRRALPY